MKLSFYSITMLALATSMGCADQRPNTMFSHERGSDEFKNALDLGYGANHPAINQASSTLQLAGGTDRGIFSLSLDPAADIWGSLQFDTSLQTPIKPNQSLLQWSRDYIASHKTELGLDAAELSTFGNSFYEPLPNQSYVTFQRQYQGREVRGAFVQLIFAHDADGYRLREVVNSSFGPIALKSTTSVPAVSSQTAIDATGIPSLTAVGQKSLIYPQLGVDGKYEFRLATEWELADQDVDEKFKVILDEESQSILAAQSSHFHVKQQLQMETFKNSYVTKEVLVEPFYGVKVDAANADANGVIDSAATQATISLTSSRGPVINVQGNAQNLTPVSFPVTFAAGGVTKVGATSGVDPAALNAYAALWEVNAWVSRFLTAQQAPILTAGIPAKVNSIGPANAPYCNAFYQAGTLNFFLQGTMQNVTCANTALIKDVMYHEWGHALDDQVGVQPGITDLAFSEGIGDINATLATGEPILGKGFFLNDATSSVRSVQNVRVYPPANTAEAEVHSAGQIIGGAFWDLRQNLVALYGVEEGTNRVGKFFFLHLLVTDRYIDSYASLLRLDDNDNNPATRSPSYCSINKAFAKHKLIGAAVAEGPSCLDQDQGLKVRVDVDNGKGSLNLIASSFGATSIIFCPGKVTACTTGAAGTVEFKAVTSTLTASDTKKFYQAAATVSVKAGEMYTLISRDSTGNPIGVKTLSFGARDQAQDLSHTLK